MGDKCVKRVKLTNFHKMLVETESNKGQIHFMPLIDSFVTASQNFGWCQMHQSVIALADFIEVKRCCTFLAHLVAEKMCP